LNQIKTLTEKIGEGVRQVRTSVPEWGRSSPTVSIIVESEAASILTDIENLIEQDPLGTLGTPIGDIHMHKYGFLAKESNSHFPYKFTVRDILTDAPYICAQLVAEEYFEEGPESTPFALEAFLSFDFNNNCSYPKEWKDPFETFDRPKVEVECHNLD
jgi:hypothetical protein